MNIPELIKTRVYNNGKGGNSSVPRALNGPPHIVQIFLPPECAESGVRETGQIITEDMFSHETDAGAIHAIVEGFYATEPLRFNGENQFEHIKRTLDILNRTLPAVSEDMRIAVLIHDIVDRTFFAEDPAISHKNLRALESILENIVEPETRVYTMGVASSAQQYELEATQWRSKVREVLEEGDDSAQRAQIPEIDRACLETYLQEIDAKDGKKNLRANLLRALNNASTEITSEMKKFHCPTASLEGMIDVLMTHDIEGLVLKAAETISNLQSEFNGRPSVKWKYAQQLLSFYGPLLEFAGVRDLATDCYSEAYWYLYDNPEKKQRAIELREQAIGCNTCRKMKEYMENSFLAMNIPFGKFEYRVKSLGSILKKLTTNPTYFETNNIPDIVGIRVIVDDKVTPAEILELSKVASELLTNFRPEIKARPIKGIDFPHIDIVYEGLEDASPSDNNISVVQPTRKGQYQRSHIDFVVEQAEEKPEIGVELQIMRAQDEEEYYFGPSAHPFYKLKQGFGNIGRLASAYFNGKNMDPELKQCLTAEYLEEIVNFRPLLKEVYRRASYFYYNPENSKLAPETLDLVWRLAHRVGLENYLPDYEILRRNLLLANST